MNFSFSRPPSAWRGTPIAERSLRIAAVILVIFLFSAPRALADEGLFEEAWDIKRPHSANTPAPCPEPEPAWELVWGDDFDDADLDGWTCETYTNHDVVELVDDGNGWCLHAASPSSPQNCGYLVQSPRLDLAGLDFTRSHRIQFRFMIPNQPNVGSVILRTQAVTLELGEVNPTAGIAEFGWTDQDFAYRRLGQIRLGEWHLMTIGVTPLQDPPDWNRFRIFLDAKEIGMGEAPRASWRTVALFNPPYELVEGKRPVDPPALEGGGFWDDFKIEMRKLPPGGGGGGKIVPTVSPNPSNPSTEIRFELPHESWVTVDVFAVNGRRVIRLWEGFKPTGLHHFPWDGTDAAGRTVSSGVYFGQVGVDEAMYSVRMTMLK